MESPLEISRIDRLTARTSLRFTVYAENELELYLAQLPEDLHDPMDNLELGTFSKFSPSSRPTEINTPSKSDLCDTDHSHSLIPCPDYFTTDNEAESAELTRTGELQYLDLSKETQANTELLKILCDIGAPLHTYQTLINWAKKHSFNGYNFQTRYSTYGSMISHLQRTFQMHEYRPIIYELKLPCPSKSNFEYVLSRVTTFNFTRLLHSLLSDPEINKAENQGFDTL